MSINILNKIKKIHFIGIGGIGIGGIAEICIKKGYIVSGSDIISNKITDNLFNLGAKIYIGHNKNNIYKSDIIIKSSAIKFNNLEVIEAINLNIPIFNRSDILPELTKKYYCISISGTHGKTTTTSVLCFVFKYFGLDITFINGGLINNLNKNCDLGKSKYFIIESDESDLTFLSLNPKISIVTNIDKDHLESYKNDFNELKKSFIFYLNKKYKEKKSILCIDNNFIKEIIDKINCKIITYGFKNNADVFITDYKQNMFISTFTLNSFKYKNLNFKVKLNHLPGKYNALNTTASIIASINEGIDVSCIKEALFNFKGINRRFELLNLNFKNINLYKKKLTFISDYGHHPSEINEVISNIRLGWNNYRIVMIFQPHRFTRIKNLFYEFINVLLKVDYLIILNIFSAGEDNVYNISSRDIFKKIKLYKKHDVILVEDINYIPNIFKKILLYNDLVLIQGAGDVHNNIIDILSNIK